MKTFVKLLLLLGIAATVTSCASTQAVYVEPAPPPPPPAYVTMINTIPIAPPALVITTGPGSMRLRLYVD